MSGLTIPTIPSLSAGYVVQLADLQNLAACCTFALGKPATRVVDEAGGGTIGTSYGTVGFTDASFDVDGMWATSFLTGQNSTFEGGNGNWVAAANTTIANTSAQAHTGVNSLALTSVAAGNTAAQSCASASFATQAMAVTAGMQVAASAWYRAATVARSVFTDVFFLNAAGSGLGLFGGAGVTNTTTGWTRQESLVTAPAGAAWAIAVPTVQSTAAANEVHYVDDVTLTAPADRLTIQTPGWYKVRYGINVGTVGGVFNTYAQSTTGGNNPQGSGVVSHPAWQGYTAPAAGAFGWAGAGGIWPFFLYAGDYIQILIEAASAGASTGTTGPVSTTDGYSYFSLEYVSIT